MAPRPTDDAGGSKEKRVLPHLVTASKTNTALCRKSCFSVPCFIFREEGTPAACYEKTVLGAQRYSFPTDWYFLLFFEDSVAASMKSLTRISCTNATLASSRTCTLSRLQFIICPRSFCSHSVDRSFFFYGAQRATSPGLRGQTWPIKLFVNQY